MNLLIYYAWLARKFKEKHEEKNREKNKMKNRDFSLDCGEDFPLLYKFC